MRDVHPEGTLSGLQIDNALDVISSRSVLQFNGFIRGILAAGRLFFGIHAASNAQVGAQHTHH
jgi:uncharacterized NAD(P)/FAD-binding protein YdhS